MEIGRYWINKLQKLTIAKGLFLCKRARPDVQSTVAMSATRVAKPNQHDWFKLVRLMKYLNGTRKHYFTLAIENMKIIKWYVDTLFAVHPDFGSHTGGFMTMGTGAIQSGSMKQKLNTRFNTEEEIVGVDEIAAKIFWTELFIEAQGYQIEKIILFQDNKSSILLEVNEKKGREEKSRNECSILFHHRPSGKGQCTNRTLSDRRDKG